MRTRAALDPMRDRSKLQSRREEPSAPQTRCRSAYDSHLARAQKCLFRRESAVSRVCFSPGPISFVRTEKSSENTEDSFPFAYVFFSQPLRARFTIIMELRLFDSPLLLRKRITGPSNYSVFRVATTTAMNDDTRCTGKSH